MRKVKKILSLVLMFTLTIVMCNGFSVVSHATEKNTHNFLPDNLHSIKLDSLSNTQINKLNKLLESKAPAPGLTSLEIVGLALDERNEIHVQTKEIGTSKAGTNFVWCNGSLCKENIEEGYLLWNSDNIAIGHVRFFHTGIICSSALKGTALNVKAKSTNAMYPWNTLSTSSKFTFE